jgi:cytochrome c peroxidase
MKPGAWSAAVGAALVLLLLGGGVGCGAPGIEPVEPPRGPFPPPPPTGLELYRPTPPDNPLTPERVALGRRLFFDPIVSRDGSLSCAGCHVPELGFSDTLRVSAGVEGRLGTRTTPTLLNRAYGRAFFWDGRGAELEEAVVGAIGDPAELDLGLEALVGRLASDESYRRAFTRAFPGEDDPVSGSGVARALASYVRTLVSGDAPADRYRIGENGALSEKALEGRRVFQGRARCGVCHAGPNFTDEEFHNTGVAVRSGDPGRYVVTGRDEDRGRFRTPTLREVALTAPYMHDGSVATLEEVVRFYDEGGEPNPNLTPDLRPLALTPGEREALVAFLQALSGTIREGAH